jgi:hypothetical protein
MNIRTVFGKLDDWILRREALGLARAELASRGEARERAARQAALLIEIARRVAEPVEALPAGAPSAVLLDLYRDAAYWALIAAREGEGEPPQDLARLWAEAPAERLGNGRDAATVEAVKKTLVDGAASRSLDAGDDDVARARSFVESMVSELNAPRRQVERILVQRWSRIALVGLIVVALGFGVRSLTRGPNLAEGKTYKTSSSWSGCVGDPTCTALLFHTDPEQNPWAELDLGAPRSFRRIEVTNRADCCPERAVPMVIEMSTDRVNWTEIAKRDKEFSTWTAKFPAKTARYLRFKVLKHSVLHLQEIAVRP